MQKYKAEVEYDDDSASMAGASCGTVRRAEIFTLEASSASDVPNAIREDFKKNRYYSTVRNIRNITEA